MTKTNQGILENRRTIIQQAYDMLIDLADSD